MKDVYCSMYVINKKDHISHTIIKVSQITAVKY